MNALKSTELFMLDMDGTIYNEDVLIPGALEFFDLLNARNIPYVFMTNNSSRGKADYVKKLTHLGIKASEKNIASSVNAVISYLNQHNYLRGGGGGGGGGHNLYCAGTESFRRELQEAGFVVKPESYRGSDIDYVVLGFDTELTYEKISGVCYYVSRDYPYIATNCDIKCPILENKYIPDCGAIARMIECATGKMPLFLGKPDPAIIEAVSSQWNVPIKKITCIGDRLYTDIAVAVNAGALSICVLSGEATINDIEMSSVKPDYCFASIKEVYEALR